MEPRVLLAIIDMLPFASHVREAHLSGHGADFGAFAAEELAWR